MPWPADADGDAFRRLEQQGFDFTIRHKIDFQIDFASWPPSGEVIALLESNYSSVVMYDPDSEMSGYIELSVIDYLTYELVIEIQNRLSQLVNPYGGKCDSWGVLSDTLH